MSLAPRPSVPTRPPVGPRLRLRPRRRHHQRRRWPSIRALAGLARQSGLAGAAGLATTMGVLALALAVAATPAAAAGDRAAAQPAHEYVPPVGAPIVDPFRPPSGPYGPGNRGLEYDTEPGEPVRASGPGTVVFAGPVGGALHVTIRHADGVRTSYSFLASIDVVQGQRVDQGDTVGEAGDRLHFGARAGDAYFDPALLFGPSGEPVRVELVPFEIPPGSSPNEEAAALREIAFGGGSALPGLPELPDPPSPADATTWLRDRAETTAHYVRQLSNGHALTATIELGRRILFPGPCSDEPPPDAPVRGRHQVAVTVAGLGSTSDNGSIDELRTAELGYRDDRVVRFSYAGGKAPGSGRAIDVPSSRYTSDDTQGDLRVAGARLADLLVDVLAAEPASTVDVFAHSQGGVVTRLALLELAERGVDLGRFGLVATLGSPHQGADLATAVNGANTHLTTNLGLDTLENTLDTGIDPDSRAVAQLAETSDVIGRLRRDGVPPGVDLVSIAGRADWVVAAPNTAVAGATNVTVPVGGPSAHGDLVASDAATGELARALAGRPPACERVGDVVADVLVGQGISATEDAGGALVQLVGP
jgi:murein DD-endopeptidase MepM/ murein hydrolase activator NlpD